MVQAPASILSKIRVYRNLLYVTMCPGRIMRSANSMSAIAALLLLLVTTDASTPPFAHCVHKDWVNASCWGWDASDATFAIQSAINTNASTVFVDARQWNVGPIHLNASGQTLLLADGCSLLSREGGFPGNGDSLLTISKMSGVTVSGYRALLGMPTVPKGAFRMGINIIGTTNTVVEGVRIHSTGGDGIYVGPADAHPAQYADCHNTTIRDVSITNASRCGLGLTGSKGLLVENVVIDGTHGASPESAVDIEPGSSYHHAENMVFRNVTVSNSNGYNFAISLHGVDEPPSITLDGVTVGPGGRLGGFYLVYWGPGTAGGTVRIANSHVTEQHEGCLILEHKALDAARIVVENTELGPGCADRGNVGMYDRPIYINAKNSVTGGLELNNVTIHDRPVKLLQNIFSD